MLKLFRNVNCGIWISAASKTSKPCVQWRCHTKFNSRNKKARIARLDAHLKDLSPSAQLKLQLEIDALKHELSNRNKVIFGTSSEKRPLDQPKQPKQPKPSQTGHGPTEQVELEVIEKEHVLDEADMKCKSCGKSIQWKADSRMGRSKR